jgi:hypothetical protein
VSEYSGVSLTTVKRHYKKETTDLEQIVKEINNPTTAGTPGIEFNNGIFSGGTNCQPDDYTHPDCPQWVINYIQTVNFL